MKYLHLFENITDFQTKRANNYIEPWVSWTADNGKVNYNKSLLETPLTFKILSDGVISWRLNNASGTAKTIEYRKITGDTQGEWTQITSATSAPSIQVSAGDKVEFRGTNSTYSNGTWFNSFDPTANAVTSAPIINVYGNIMSLVDKNNYATMTALTDDYTFKNLFIRCRIVNAYNLLFPATTLTTGCYEVMFKSNTLLITPPQLPQLSTVPARVFYCLFQDCSSLEIAPELPATTLGENCYAKMFENCASLVRGPSILPATTLTNTCYSQMFSGCTNLVKAPELPAATLTSSSYFCMFQNCTNLNYIKCLATNTSATDCVWQWVSGVQTTSGVFVKDPTMSWPVNANGIPTNWTVINDGDPVPVQSANYNIHKSTKMTNSEIVRIPNSLNIRNFNDGGSTSDWGYQDGIMLKAIMDTYNEFNASDYDLSSFTTYVNNYYNTKVQNNGSVNSNYTSTELDDKELAVALMKLYDITGTAKYKSCIDTVYGDFSGITKNADGVYWHKTNYPRQGWLDGLYMAHPFRAEYASKYLTGSAQTAVYDDVCFQIKKMAERTYDSATGLYRHAYDTSSLENSTPATWVDPNSLNGMQSYYIWGRGLGWLMMAIVDVLDFIPLNHSGRLDLINILIGICSNLKRYADSTTGVWRNLPTEGAMSSGNENAFESSSSCMYAYAWLKGVRKGYLPLSEKEYALSVFNSIENTFVVKNSNGTVSLSNVCKGGNPGNSCSTKQQVLDLYCSKDYMSNNTHGVAPYIWAAIEYEKLVY